MIDERIEVMDFNIEMEQELEGKLYVSDGFC